MFGTNKVENRGRKKLSKKQTIINDDIQLQMNEIYALITSTAAESKGYEIYDETGLEYYKESVNNDMYPVYDTYLEIYIDPTLFTPIYTSSMSTPSISTSSMITLFL